VSSENKGGSKVVFIDGYGPGTVALGVFFFILVGRFLIFSIFPFPVGTAQFIDEVWNNQ
jgi:hypothetical protein